MTAEPLRGRGRGDVPSAVGTIGCELVETHTMADMLPRFFPKAFITTLAGSWEAPNPKFAAAHFYIFSVIAAQGKGGQAAAVADVA